MCNTDCPILPDAGRDDMITKTLSFREVEHDDDLDDIIDDLVESGAKIIDSCVNEYSEIGYVLVGVDEDKKQDFIDRFKKTGSYGLTHNL